MVADAKKDKDLAAGRRDQVGDWSPWSGMTVSGMTVLHGPSLIAWVPVVQLSFVGLPGAAPSAAMLEALEARLLGCLGTGPVDTRSQLLPGYRSLAKDGTVGLPGIVAWTAVQLQRLLRFTPTLWHEFALEDASHRGSLFEHQDGVVADLIAGGALDLVTACVQSPDRRDAADELLARILAILDGKTLGHIRFAIAREAARRGIPCRRLPDDPNRLMIGQGVKLQRFYEGYSQDTAYLGARIATNKHSAARLFRAHGLPAPVNLVARETEEARSAAEQLDYPLVVKPVKADYGTAVSLDIRDQESLDRAFALAQEHGPVLVERQIDGDNHRILVIDGTALSVVRQRPAQVTGDGRSSVRDLIERTNEKRTDDLSGVMKKISIDSELEAVLAGQSLGLEDVPPAGQEVALRLHSNLSRGGTNENVTPEVHPDNLAMAERAARVVGLDLAGIDFITTDISRPFHEVGGGICEINPNPGWVMGDGPDIAAALFDRRFPNGDDGRIPIVAIAGGETSSDAARETAALLAGCGLCAGLATEESLHVGDRCAGRGAFGAELGGRALLDDPGVAAVVQAVALSQVWQEGLAFDRCSVAVLGPGSGAEAGTAHVLRLRVLLAGLARWLVVLPANEPNLARIREAAGATPLCLVASQPPDTTEDLPATETDLVVTVARRDAVVAVTFQKAGAEPLVIERPMLADDAFQAETLAYACAAALGCGLSPAAVQAAFDATAD